MARPEPANKSERINRKQFVALLFLGLLVPAFLVWKAVFAILERNARDGKRVSGRWVYGQNAREFGVSLIFHAVAIHVFAVYTTVLPERYHAQVLRISGAALFAGFMFWLLSKF